MKRTKILSIDDSKAVHSFINLCLPSESFEIVHAYSAEEGLEILKKTETNIELILLDWEMPGLTGPEALVEIRRLGITTPIVMVTTKNDPEEISMVLDRGASEYVMKPFTPEILIEKIETLTKAA